LLSFGYVPARPIGRKRLAVRGREIWSHKARPDPPDWFWTSQKVKNIITNGDLYTFTVTATNGVGAGPAATASNSVIPATVPGAPAIGNAAAANAQATITFNPGSSNGLPISSYTVLSTDLTNAARGARWSTSGPTSPITVTGLTNGDSYTFIVTAKMVWEKDRVPRSPHR
jgi:hypothetical protein